MKSISVLSAVCCLLSVVSAQWFDSLCAIQCGPDTFIARVPANGPHPWFYDSSSSQLVFTQYTSGGKTYMLDCSTDSVVDSADVFFTQPAVFDQTDRKVYGFSNRYSPDFAVTDLNARTQRVLLHGPFEGGAVAWIPSANKVCFSDYGRTYQLYFFDCANDSLTSELPFWPGSLCVNPQDNKVYFQHLDSTYIVSASSGTIIGRVSTRLRAGPALWNRNDDIVYALGSGHMYRISGSGDTLLPDFNGSYDGELCALSTKSNTLYLFDVYGGLQAVSCATGDPIATVPGFRAGRIEYDSINDRLYGIVDGGYPACVYVLGCSTNVLLREIGLPEVHSQGICWVPEVQKVYCGGDLVMQVEESKSLDPSALASPATVSHVLPVDAAVFDAMGRRVADPKSGVYFVRDEGRGAGDVGRMGKVIIQH